MLRLKRAEREATSGGQPSDMAVQAEVVALRRMADESLGAATRKIEQLERTIAGEFDQSVELSVVMSELLCMMAWANGNVHKLSGETVSISGAVEEMTRTIQNIADLSKGVGGSSAEAARLADAGAGRAAVAGQAMTEISASFAGLDKRMASLGGAIDSIGGFAKQIEGISSQTKLLALNATIEAARAGEAGRGFAVVAAEVKALSEETSKTTELIRGQLSTLGDVMQSMLLAMNEGGTRVREGQEIFSEVLSDMNGIRSCVGGVNGSIGSINQMLSDQHSASESIAKSLNEIARLAAQNEADSKTTGEMIRKADTAISHLVDDFSHANVRHADVRRFRAEHMIWKRSLAECLVGLRKADPEGFAKENHPLGKAFRTVSRDDLRSAPWGSLEADAGALAADAIKLVQASAKGDIGKAIEFYMTIDKLSGDLMVKLAALNRGGLN
ncbi:methyl-accepting chemotaxis protein [Oryzibacter oryziterrae]|uniref:methyl-accepting chemotaxis protein n=1 Tax=Oryzibacter oryziterrae TaxID=2766474 RepID=UPI001F01E4FC|nr:methyl-accepting chemotaxis protein [Oryzibacter oryziterrae]